MKRILYILILLACFCAPVLAQETDSEQETISREMSPQSGRLRSIVRQEILYRSGLRNYTRLHPDYRNNGMPIGIYSAMHYLIGIWGDGGFSMPFSLTDGMLKGECGSAHTVGLSFDVQNRFVKGQIGLGYRRQTLSAGVQALTMYDHDVTDAWGYQYHLRYDFRDRKDIGTSHTIQIPLLMGAGVDMFYAMAGVKLQINHKTSATSEAIASTSATYDQFLGVFEEMDHHGLRKDVPITYTEMSKPWTIFDLYGSLEVGWEIAGGMQLRGTTKYKPTHMPDRGPEWRFRAALFCDVNMLHRMKGQSFNDNTQPEQYLVDIPAESKWDFSTFRMNNTLFSTNGIPGRSDFVVGLKLTFCIGFYDQECVPCLTDEIR